MLFDLLHSIPLKLYGLTLCYSLLLANNNPSVVVHNVVCYVHSVGVILVVCLMFVWQPFYWERAVHLTLHTFYV